MAIGSNSAEKSEGMDFDSKSAANQKRPVKPATKNTSPPLNSAGASPMKTPPASNQTTKARSSTPNSSKQQPAARDGRGNGAKSPAAGAQKSAPNATKNAPHPQSPTRVSPRQNPKSRASKPQTAPPQSVTKEAPVGGTAAHKSAPGQGKATGTPGKTSARPPPTQPGPSRSRSPRQTNPLATSSTHTKPVEPAKVATATKPGAQASTAPLPAKGKRPLSPRAAAQSPSSNSVRKQPASTAPARPGAQAATGAHASKTKGPRSAGASDRKARAQTPTTVSDDKTPGAKPSTGTHASGAKGLRSGGASRKGARAQTQPPNEDSDKNPGAQTATGSHASTTKGPRSAGGKARPQTPPPNKENRKPGAQAVTGNHASKSKGKRSTGIRRARTTEDHPGANGDEPDIHGTRSMGSPARSRIAEPGVVAQRQRRVDHSPERTESLNTSAKVGAQPSNRAADPSRRKQARKKRGASSTRGEPEIQIPPAGPRNAPVAVAARSARGVEPAEDTVVESVDNGDEVREEMDESHNTTAKNRRDESEADSRRDENLVEAFVVEDTPQNQAPMQVIVQAAVEVDENNNSNKQSEEAEKRRFYMFIVLVMCCGLVLVVVAIVVAVVVVVAQSNSGNSSDTSVQGPLIPLAPRPDDDTPPDVAGAETESFEYESLEDLPNFEERDQYYDWFYDMAVETIVMGVEAAEEYLDDEANPYRKALTWIVFKDSMQLTPGVGLRRARQRYIMALFYYETTIEGDWRACNPPEEIIASTLGDEADLCEHEVLQLEGHGVDSAHYTVKTAIRWLTKSKECSWAGVTCSKDGFDSVGRIRLGGYGLSGSIPPEFEHLPKLKMLLLPYNNLEGQMLDWVGSAPQLQVLNLELNRLEGDIPLSMCDSTDLQTIELGGNNLHGTIPSCWGDEVANLQYIDLSQNRLSGTIPAGLGNLEGLRELQLQNNELTGEMHRDVCARPGFGLLSVIGADCWAPPYRDAELPCPCCTICCNRDGACEDVEPETPQGGRPQRRSGGPFLR